jgi:periplasmic copper chaperone A
MNSLTQERERTSLEQRDSPETAASPQGAALLAAPLSRTPVAGKPQPRQYLLLVLGGLGMIALFSVLAAMWIAAAPTNSGAAAGGGIVVEDAWARAATRPSEGTGGTSAIYMLIRNEGGEQDQLIGATSDAAATTEVHRTQVEDGVMRMRPAGPVEVPAGGTVTLQPGGLHVMLIDLQRDLVAGERLSVTLQFERAGDLRVDAEVRAPMPAPMSAPMHGR